MGGVCTCQAALLRDGQSEAWLLPRRESSAIAQYLVVRQKFACSESLGATNHALFSPLLLGAGKHVAIGHFAGLLVAERLSAPSM